VQSKLIPSLKANYLIWPAAHLINFAFIPSSQRILYINVINVRLGSH
jgi:protein Mpv17